MVGFVGERRHQAGYAASCLPSSAEKRAATVTTFCRADEPARGTSSLFGGGCQQSPLQALEGIPYRCEDVAPLAAHGSRFTCTVAFAAC